MLIIGLTGTNGAGKGTVADILIDNGFDYHSLSDIIREEITRNKLPLSRETLIKTGNQLRTKFGPSVLADKTITKINSQNTVIDSIRNPHEVAALKKLKNFRLISVDARPEIRFNRVMLRGRNESVDSLKAFIEIENREKSKNTNAQQINLCIDKSDYQINNNSSMDDLNKNVINTINKIKETIKNE